MGHPSFWRVFLIQRVWFRADLIKDFSGFAKSLWLRTSWRPIWMCFQHVFFLPWFSPRMFRWTQKQSKHIYTKHYQTKPKSCTIFASSMGILSKSCALQLKLQLYDWHMSLKNYLTVSSKWWKFDRGAFCGAANRFQRFLCPDFAWGQHSAEQAAKELQEAMNSGDAQVLMNAIDNAKWHKVNQEAGNSDANSDRNAADRYF